MKKIKGRTIFITYLFVGLSFHLNVDAQKNGCIDSVSLNQYFPSYFTASVANPNNSFLYTPQRDTADNIYLSGSTNTGAPFGYWSIVKFNAANQLQWYRNYRTDLFTTFKNGGMLHAIEGNGNLVFSETIQNIANPNSSWQIISKADNGGNLLWSKIIKHGTDPNFNGGINPPVLGNNGELFCTGRFGDMPDKPFIIALDNAGNIIWNKRYRHITVPKFHLMGSHLVSQNSSTLVMAVQYYYNADVVTDPAAKFGIQLVKINRLDGSIVQQKAITYFNDAASIIPNRAILQKINYNANTNRFLLVFQEYNFITRFIFSLIDSNLNLIKTVHYSAPSTIAGLPKISIDKNNTTLLIKSTSGGSSVAETLAYTAVNNNLDIITQKFINLTSIGFPNRNFQADMAYKKNGILNFQLATYTGIVVPNYLFLFDHSPFYNNISPCLGIDSAIYLPLSIYVNPSTNPTIEEDDTVPLQLTNQFPDYPPVDFALPKIETCKTVSICDTIKLFGTQYHCLSSPIDSFKIYRNPLCKRKTDWQVDTAYIKILNQNDTSLHVQYLTPYRGSIKVGFGGCSLTDSIAIEVYDANTGINLGNDTMHCPGKTIILKAGKGFKTYQWQDGSTIDSLMAAQPGLYHVSATDSCGNIFKDTLVINPFDVTLNLNYPQPLCLKDTAGFTLPDKLYNYSWLPNSNSSLNGFSWRLFPPVTTTYNITGERLPGCTISDTVLINVNPNCLPDYIYFPTGFTPNGDGLNDIYKPGINGQLAVYEFAIYNRYGQPVFKTNDPAQGWDGHFKNSKNPLAGGYVWMCRYQFTGKALQHEQGTFTLIR
jgi:gliding motility-associated-like protein